MFSRAPSTLTLLLGAVFFFATNVFAASAVLGIDLGTGFIKAALVKPGIPLEIVLTKDSRRKEASVVAFKPSRDGPSSETYPERAYGSDAVALSARFPGDVYPNLKAILGLPAEHDLIQEYVARHPALQLEAHGVRGTAAFKSKAFTDDVEAWMVEELLAMELQSIQKNAQALAGNDVTVGAAVLTVPPYLAIEEKRAVQLSAELAGFKVLGLLSDGLAVGLNYATSRQFPNVSNGEKAEYHMVFDMGAGSTKATVMKFQSRSVKDVGKLHKTVQEVAVLGSGWDRTLGGDALNSLIVDDMVSKFVESKAAQKASVQADGVKAHGRAVAKLTKEAERLRHILSANSNTQGGFEGLYEDVDFKYKIDRAAFEALAEGHAARVGVAIQDALKMAGLELTDLDSIILHGGASRTPFVQKELERIVGAADKIRTNVNSDESAVFGAGFRAAELSPSFRVKEIRLHEGGMYPTHMKWTNGKDELRHQRLFSAVSAQGAVKEFTFNNLNDFDATFYQKIGERESDVSILSTQNLTETVAALKEKYSCDDAGIQLKVGIKLSTENGEVEVVNAAVECEADVVESFVDGVKNLFGFGKKDKDQKPLGGDEEGAENAEAPAAEEAESSATPASDSADAETPASSATDAESTQEATTKREIVSIPVKVAVEKAGSPALSKEDIKKAKDRLKAFETSDKARHQREEALNQLEAFTYKIRELLDSESFLAACTEEERSTLESKSADASEWLYGDGANAAKEEFKAKYKELNDIATRVQKRIEEAEQRPKLVSGLKQALEETSRFMQTIKDQIEEYEKFQASASAKASESTEAPSAGDFDGLEDEEPAEKPRNMEDAARSQGPVPPLYEQEDIDNMVKLHQDTETWLEKLEKEQEALSATADPVLLVKDIKAKRDKLDKAGVDLAMKGVKNLEKNKKASSSSSKKSKTKSSTKTSTKTADGEPAGETLDFGDASQFINLGKDGEMPSEEDIQKIIDQIQKQQGQKPSERDEL